MKKKFIALTLAFVLLLPLIACGGQEAAQEQQNNSKFTAEELAMELDFPNIPPELAAKMELDIYMIAGQSNAAGSTNIISAKEGERDLNTYENVRYYCNSRYINGADHGVSKEYGPVHENLGYAEGKVGPELGMARALNDKYATNERKAIIFKVASGGTSLLLSEDTVSATGSTSERFFQRGSWLPSSLGKPEDTDPDRPTGYLTRLLKSSVEEFYADLLARGFSAENIHFKALCWMQGETDRKSSRRYFDVFPEFAKEIRSHICTVSGQPDFVLPIVVGEISETYTSAMPDDVTTNQKMIAVQHKLTEVVPALTVIPSSGYAMNQMENGASVAIGSDTYHWNYHDILEIGELFGNAAYGNQ